ncbi:HEPN domain-containing protein [Glaciimonas sp. GG7]
MNITSPQYLILKAHRAIASAQVLHNIGDIEGACNRAYYAMFDAAKAALLKINPSGNPMFGRMK